jgi:small conductance mechanosensitive channel
MLGVETTSFVAILGGAGLAVGLALQGSLANFAGGVLILIFKPFKVGDFIEAQGHSGTVKEIALFNTILNTPDKKTVIIPNGAVSNGSITNYSAEEMRRVDFLFGIGYEDDLKKAKDIIWDELKKDDRILSEPESLVVISELADSSVNITVRVWCKTEHYWPIYFNIIENVKLAFDAASISIPFPQQELHVRMKQ